MAGEHVHRRTQTVCLVVLAVVAIGAALRELQSVLVPFVLAVFGGIAARPLVGILQRRARFPEPLAVITVLLLAAGVLFAIGLVISVAVDGFLTQWETYQGRVQQLVEQVKDWLRSHELIPPNDVPADAAEQSAQASRRWERAVSWVQTLMSSAGTLVSQLGLVLVFLSFLLFGVGPRGETLVEAGHRVRTFLLLKTFVSLITGGLVWVVLSFYGVDLALVFGVLTVLLNFVPSIGSIVATLLPVPIVLLSDQLDGTEKALAIGIPGLIQLVVGNVVEPKLMGGSLNMHPIVQILALLIWGVLWGPIGILLAVPLTAAIQVALEHTEGAEWVADMMAGKLPGEARVRDAESW